MVSNTTPEQAQANRANTIEGFAVYLEDPREYVADRSLSHGLTPDFRAAATRAGNCSPATKTLARSAAKRCPYSNKAFIVEQRWDAKGVAWVETVMFVITDKRCFAVA